MTSETYIRVYDAARGKGWWVELCAIRSVGVTLLRLKRPDEKVMGQALIKGNDFDEAARQLLPIVEG